MPFGCPVRLEKWGILPFTGATSQPPQSNEEPKRLNTQYNHTDEVQVLQTCTLETCMILLSNVTPINLIKKESKSLNIIFYMPKAYRNSEQDKRHLGSGSTNRLWVFCLSSSATLEISVEEGYNTITL